MAKKTKKKKSWQIEEKKLTPLQKGIIVSVLSFIPFFLFVLLPILTRNHFVKQLKIRPDIFLSPPETINLVKTSEVGKTFKLKINGVEFKIPVDLTPIRIGSNFIEFSKDSRRLSHKLSIISSNEPQKIEFSSTGFARWFMPKTVFDFMKTMLRATWHPIRLMFKAQFFANEGIASKVFEARWDAHHLGFIFPTQGGAGYVGRVFRTDGPGYFEFSLVDQVNPITLRQWVNLAMKIKPPGENRNEIDPYAPTLFNLKTLQQQVLDPDRQVDVLSRSLNEYFRTGKVMWLIPVAIVMRERGFHSQVIDLHRTYLNAFPIDSPLKEIWNDILEQTVNNTLKLEIDPSLCRKELKIYLTNLTERQINNIFLKIIVKHSNGTEKSFFSHLLRQERLFEKQERELLIKVPNDISVNDAERFEYHIMQIDFVE